jgi:hypothetical protein
MARKRHGGESRRPAFSTAMIRVYLWQKIYRLDWRLSAFALSNPAGASADFVCGWILKEESASIRSGSAFSVSKSLRPDIATHGQHGLWFTAYGQLR